MLRKWRQMTPVRSHTSCLAPPHAHVEEHGAGQLDRGQRVQQHVHRFVV